MQYSCVLLVVFMTSYSQCCVRHCLQGVIRAAFFFRCSEISPSAPNCRINVFKLTLITFSSWVQLKNCCPYIQDASWSSTKLPITLNHTRTNLSSATLSSAIYPNLPNSTVFPCLLMHWSSSMELIPTSFVGHFFFSCIISQISCIISQTIQDLS